MTLYENEDVRAASVNAAANALGENAWYRRDKPGGTEFLPSPALMELTRRIEVFIHSGAWEGPTDD